MHRGHDVTGANRKLAFLDFTDRLFENFSLRLQTRLHFESLATHRPRVLNSEHRENFSRALQLKEEGEEERIPATREYNRECVHRWNQLNSESRSSVNATRSNHRISINAALRAALYICERRPRCCLPFIIALLYLRVVCLLRVVMNLLG